MPVRGISLTDIPTIERVDSVDLGPNDVLVFSLPYAISDAQAQSIMALVEFAWPGRKAIILDKGAKLTVVGGV